MNYRFETKTTLFYVVAIGSVLTLFQVISAYGERYLNAPANINGRYVSTAAPPGCRADDRLVLDIQQSGIYLNGSLLLQADTPPPAVEASSENQLPLTGELQQGQVTLMGKTDAFAACAASPRDSHAASEAATATLRGQVAAQPEGLFAGQLSLDNGAQPWQFQAQRQTQPKVETPAH
ncbi:hypothetical protein IFO70_18815 [Phormidium tenue FACHB-886]|nr:hypothetical protein [Phormidium tenue FACHB-886]